MSRVDRITTRSTYCSHWHLWSALRSPLDPIARALLGAEVVSEGEPPRGGIAMDYCPAEEHGDSQAGERAAGPEKRREFSPESQAVPVYLGQLLQHTEAEGPRGWRYRLHCELCWRRGVW